MNTPRLSPHLAAVRCFACDEPHDPRRLLGVCDACGMPLRATGFIRDTDRVVVFNTGTGLKYR